MFLTFANSRKRNDAYEIRVSDLKFSRVHFFQVLRAESATAGWFALLSTNCRTSKSGHEGEGVPWWRLESVELYQQKRTGK